MALLCLKKVCRDELLQLAIILSLLRVDPESLLGYNVHPFGVGIHNLTDGTSWSHSYAETLIQRRLYLHPKSLDSVLLNYEREVFEDLNALGRYNRINSHSQDVTAYLLNVDGNGVPSSDIDSTSASSSSSVPSGVERPRHFDEPSTSRAALMLDDLNDPTLDDFRDAAELTQEVRGKNTLSRRKG
ncbi:Uncharacterized protein GBIM_09673 [Gryllus bimaculatus]|nr:Uncharacterized protein GBIM_09673 [Gryllus bimaculatus]